jgi:hypothetical protein
MHDAQLQNMHGDNPLRLREKMHETGPPGLKSRLHTDHGVHVDDAVHTDARIHTTDRPAPCVPEVSRRRTDGWQLLLQHRDVGEIAVLLAVVEAVADDEVVLDRESDILHAHVDLAA